MADRSAPSTRRRWRRLLSWALASLLAIGTLPLTAPTAPVAEAASDLARGRPVFFDAPCPGPFFPLSNLVDGDDSTATQICDLGGAANHWIAVDLGGTYSITAFRWKDSGTGCWATHPALIGSDDRNDRNIHPVPGDQVWTYNGDINDTGVVNLATVAAHRFWYLYKYGPDTQPAGCRFIGASFELYGTKAPEPNVDVARGRPVFMDPQCTGPYFPLANLVDGDDSTATQICDMGGAANHWLAVDLGGTYAITSFRWKDSGASCWATHPALIGSDYQSPSAHPVPGDQVWSYNGDINDTGVVTLATVAAHRYWYLYKYGPDTQPAGCRFIGASFELYGAPPADPLAQSDLARSRPVFFDPQCAGPFFQLAYLVDRDDSTATQICNTADSANHWIAVDLGATYSVNAFRWKDGGPGWFATHPALIGSDDTNPTNAHPVVGDQVWSYNGDINDTGVVNLATVTAHRYWYLYKYGPDTQPPLCRFLGGSFELYGAQSAPDAGTPAPYTFGAQATAAFSPDPVNLATGSFTAHADDLSLPGRVVGFSFTRWYNSADNTPGSALGAGWTHSYNWKLSDAGATAALRRGDGRQDTFTKNPDGTYAPPPGVFDVLTKNADATFTLTLPSQVRYDFSSAGQLTRISEPAGNQLALSYSGGNLASITDSVGRGVTLSYDGSGHLAQLADPLGRRVTYAYDASGRLVTVTDKIGNGAGPAAAHQWKYAYDAATRHITTITDPDGRVRVTNTYDTQGRVVQQRDGLGALTTMAYSSGQTVLTDPRGHRTTYAFDSRLRVLAQSDPVGASTYTLAYTYDAAGNRTGVTDRNANRTDFAYDSRGNLLFKTDPAVGGSRPVTSFAYDAKNNLTGITDPLGSTTTLSYHPTSNVLLSVSRQVDATASAVTSYAYADAASPGLPTTITSPRGFATTLGYDAQGNLVRRADPDGAVTTFAYDGIGRLLTFVDPDGNAPGGVTAQHTWRVSYDENDRETSRTDPLNGVLRFGYDGAGNRTSSTDRNGNLTGYAYDANARLSSTQQKPDPAMTYTTTVARDASGNATRITQGNGASTDYGFDPLDRLVAVTTHPSGTLTLTTSYTLDGNGQPTSRTDGTGTAVAYSYDALSRLVSVSGPALSISYAYDQASRRTSMTDATGTTTYQYDRLGRVTQIAAPAGALGYSYDPDGNRSSLVYPGGQAVSYAYSPGGRLASVTDWAGRLSTYAYTPAGLVSSLALPNGGLQAYGYDLAQRLTQIDTSFGGQSLWRETYALDAEGNRTARADTALGVIPATSTAYRYDGLLRLTTLDRTLTLTGTPLSSESFVLDAATNISSRTGPAAAYSYDGANRVTSDGARAFSFDNADRLTQRGNDTFSYDALSRLTSATITSASPGASASGLYAYDGDGLLRSRTSGGSTSGYVWDSSVAIAQLLVAGSERLVHGLGPLYRVHADNSYDVLIRDALGSVRAEVSGTGALSSAFDYTAYGDVRAAFPAPPSLLGFAGELRDPSGLIYLRARWYDPAAGRFMSRDPLPGSAARPTSLNAYGYAAGSPVMFVDPLGLDSGSSDDDANFGCLKFFFCHVVPRLSDEAEAALGQTVTVAIPVRGPFGATVIEFARAERSGDSEGTGRGLNPGGPPTGGGRRGGKTTYLYQKLSAAGEHLKFGITDNPATRYTTADLAGGKLKILAEGERSEMLRLERYLHENLPLGPEEGQRYYIERQNGIGP